MTASLSAGYQNDTLLNFLLTSSGNLVSDNCVFVSVCMCAFVITCTLDLGDLSFQQGGTSPWLDRSEGWSGYSKIVPISQIVLSIHHNS